MRIRIDPRVRRLDSKYQIDCPTSSNIFIGRKGMSPLPTPPPQRSPLPFTLSNVPSVRLLLAKARNVLSNSCELIRQPNERSYACGSNSQGLRSSLTTPGFKVIAMFPFRTALCSYHLRLAVTDFSHSTAILISLVVLAMERAISLHADLPTKPKVGIVESLIHRVQTRHTNP
jgi:hypothetical protein